MKRRLAVPTWAGLVCLLAAAAGCGGGGGGDEPDSSMVMVDSGMLPDTAVAIDMGVIDIDAAIPDASVTPDASTGFITPPPQVMLVQGSGIIQVSGGGRTLNALFGLPLVRVFGVPGGNTIEPGLMPQIKVKP